MVGIRNFFRQAASLTVTGSVTLVNTDIIIPVAANQIISGIMKLFFTLPAAGGLRFQVLVPAGGVSFDQSTTFQNTVAPATVLAMVTTSTVFANAAANAGDHFADVSFSVANGTTAGNITLQFAQNSAANASILLAGSFCECIII